MHEPFLTWILQEEPLTEEQRTALEAHLAQCPTCRALDSGWGAVRRALRHYPEVSPRPGYLARWEAYRRQQQRRRRQIWLAGTLALAGISVALPLSGPVGLSALAWLLDDFFAGIRWLAQAQALWLTLHALGHLLPRALQASLLALVSLGGAGLVALWAWALWRLPRAAWPQPVSR